VGQADSLPVPLLLRNDLVLLDLPVADVNNPMRILRDIVLMRHQHDRIPLLVQRLEQTDSETEKRMFSVALQKRYATPFLPFVIALFSAPFALSLSRRGRIVTIGGAIGIWLLFTGITNIFEQFGQNGALTATFAVWPPLAIFAALGLFLLSRVRT